MRSCSKLGLKACSVTKQTRHLSFDHPSMRQVRNWVQMMVSTKQVEPRLLCNFDQVWRTHYEPAKRVLFKPVEESGVLKSEKNKPSTEQLLRSIRSALRLPAAHGESAEGSSSGPKAPTLHAQSTLIPVEYQRNARTITTLSFADGTLGRAYVTASHTTV